MSASHFPAPHPRKGKGRGDRMLLYSVLGCTVYSAFVTALHSHLTWAPRRSHGGAMEEPWRTDFLQLNFQQNLGPKADEGSLVL